MTMVKGVVYKGIKTHRLKHLACRPLVLFAGSAAVVIMRNQCSSQQGQLSQS